MEDPTTLSFYAGLGGHGVDHVWYYDPSNTADPWTTAAITTSSGKLDVPVHALVVDPAHPDTVYAGTNNGVWKGVKSVTKPWTWTWSVFSYGLPECAVLDLALHEKGRLLRAATYGRGAWEIPLDGPSVPDPDIYVRANYADSARMAGGRRRDWIDQVKDPANPGTTASHAQSADIKVVPGSQYPLLLSSGSLQPAPYMPAFDHVDFAQLSTAFTLEVFDYGALSPYGNKIVVQVHNRNPKPYSGSQVKVLLLLAAMTGPNPPALPGDYATRIANQSPDSWLGTSGWKSPDPGAPGGYYVQLAADVSAFAPRVVSFPADPVTLGWADGSVTKICAAVFVVVPNEPLVAGKTDIGELAMVDKHVAYHVFEIKKVKDLVGPSAGQRNFPLSGRGHCATLLADGRVLVTGGLVERAAQSMRAVIYDPWSKTWSMAPFMSTGRMDHAAVCLADGRVLVVGGAADGSAEVFDPHAFRWTKLPAMKFPRTRPTTAVLLPNGRMLVAGGLVEDPKNPSWCEMFDPANNSWISLPFAMVHNVSSAALIPGPQGLVLMLTWDPQKREQSCYLFDPYLDGLLPAERASAVPIARPQSKFETATMTPLPTDDVLVTGFGYNEMETSAPSNPGGGFETVTCELYRPSRQSWRSVRTKFPLARQDGYGRKNEPPTATLLQDGRVLLAGGRIAADAYARSTILYDPSRSTWQWSPPLQVPRWGHTATVLQDGRVLLVGEMYPDGWPSPNTDAAAEIYVPPPIDQAQVLYGSN